ncbi:efflux RND transporter periplasmic adaptor subunit [Planctomycetota bacterium]
MDIPREQKKGRKLIKRLVLAVIAICAITAVTVGLSRLEPAAPGVERETLLLDRVQQGNMVLEVRGVGRLMSEDRLVVPALVNGRVKRILVEPGALVEPNTVILELTNPDLQLAWLEAQSNLTSAKARFTAENARQQDRLLELEAGLANTQARLQDAKLQAEVDQTQHTDGLISDLQMTLSSNRVQQLEKLYAVEEKRFAVFKEQILPALLDAEKATVNQAQSRYNLRKNEVDSLFVRPGAIGVLAPIQTQIELGQQVSQGQILARITNPTKLKAELQIPQGQARDVLIGLPAEIDTYNGVVSGTVSRIEPTVMEGNVTVDISLNGALPKGARPDLSVVGTIQIDRLVDILYVGRPVMAAADSRTELFKVTGDGRYAERVSVQFGRTSVSTIEVREGLNLNDEIILSDVSQWDSVEKIRLK